jgi:hypothetical protein
MGTLRRRAREERTIAWPGAENIGRKGLGRYRDQEWPEDIADVPEEDQSRHRGRAGTPGTPWLGLRGDEWTVPDPRTKPWNGGPPPDRPPASSLTSSS